MQNRIMKRLLSIVMLFCMILSIYGTLFYVSEHEVHQCTHSHCSVCMQLKHGGDYLNKFSSSNITDAYTGLGLYKYAYDNLAQYRNQFIYDESLVSLSIRMDC